MKSMITTWAWLAFLAALPCHTITPSAVGANPPPQRSPQLNVFEMRSIPEGNYLATLELGTEKTKVNFRIRDSDIVAVKSSLRHLENLRGEYELIGNGVFLVRLQNSGHQASQFWLFRPDGSVIIKEIPDRGEKQKAVPVSHDGLKLEAN